MSEHGATREDKVRTAYTKAIEDLLLENGSQGLCRPRRTLTIPWLHLKIMNSVNLDESWSSKTESSG